MQRVTWSGIALHAGVVPGHPASHGCIRLTNDFAIRLWHLAKRGTRVIIARDEVRPLEIANSHLFVSTSKAAPVLPGPSAVTVSGNDNNTAPATHGALLPMRRRQKRPIFKFQGRYPQEWRVKRPISVFVSPKLSRLFVRQGLHRYLISRSKPKIRSNRWAHTYLSQWSLRTPAHLFAGPLCHCRSNLLPPKSAKQV